MANLLPPTLEVQIVRMVKALYDAAPGFTYLSAFKGLGTVDAASAQLNSNFASLTNAQWSALIVTNLHIAAISGAAAATEAQNYLIAQLAGGTTRTALLPAAMTGFATLEGSATFGASALYFNNSNATAYQYSINPANTSTDLAVLQLADEPNSAPVVGNDTAAATEGGAMIAGTLRTNDSDAQGDTLSYALAVTQAPVAGLTLNSNGSYTFDPANAAYNDILAGAVRNVVVTVTVSDGKGGTTNGTLTIAVTGTNDAPTANTVFASGAEDSAFIAITPSSTDPDTGDSATYAVVSNPTSGTVSLVGGQFQYVPNANFSGTDSFQYRVTDGSGASSVATANVTVTAVNDAPVANASSANGVEDTPIGGTVTGTDTEGSALTFAVATGPARGTVVLSTNGAYVYTPAANFNGTDSFTFTASDGLATSAARTVTITVAAANDAPVAANVFATGAEDAVGINVTPSSSDIDAGDTATYSVNSQPGHGSVSFSGGQFVYVPALNFNGVDTFTYRVTDSAGASSVATATVTVQAVNDAPVAIAGSASGNQGTVITGTVTGTDVDGDSLSYTVSTQASNGSVAINNANGNYVYTPNVGYVGADQFTFTVNDGHGGTSTAVVSLSVADVADVLTVGVDNIVLSGSTPQTVIGNQFTYNPGDSITGGTGSDTLSLGLTPGAPIVLGSATVTGVENFNVTINPAMAPDNVTLQMTTVSTHLTNVNVTQSNGHSISIVDVQNLPRFKLDDVGAHVTINIDNQVVDNTLINPGPHALTVDVREFGTGSSSTFGRSILTLDRGLETININDLAASSGFASDMKRIDVNGDAGNGYSNLNVTGGSTGTALTIQDAGSEAGGFMTSAPSYGAVQANSTTFLGNLVADIDGAGGGSGTVRTGVGSDSLTAHDDLAGFVNAGAGNDTVLVHTANLQGTIEGAAGSDSITVQGNLDSASFARIDGGDDADTISVTGFVDSTGSIIGGTGGDGITVGGNLAGSITGDDGNDNITVSGGVSPSGVIHGNNGSDNILTQGGDMLGSVFGDADGDTIQNNAVLGDNSASSNRGVLDGGAGNDFIYNYGVMEEGSSMIGGDGDDFLYMSGALLEGNLFDAVNQFQTAALISGGEGNDTAQVFGTVDGDIDMGNGNDTVQVHRNGSANVRTGSITLGDGDDIVELYDGASFTGDGESGDGLNNDGSIDGGSGNNVMNIHLRDGAMEAEVASDGTPVGPPSDGTDITNIQTLNLNTLDTFDEVPFDFERDHTFDINLQAFDTTLATINVLERDDAATVNLGGYNSEIVNVDSDGDAGTDVTLNVGANIYGEDGTGNTAGNDDNAQLNASNVGGLRDTNETLNVNLNGSSAFEIAINDAAGVNVTNLSSNGSGARTAMLDGMDQDNNGAAGGEGNSLNITGNNTSRLTVTGIYQETVNAAAYAGALSLTIANDDTVGADADAANDNESLTINTGAGDDVVNILADILDLGDVAFNLGGGTDRLIINESTRDLGGVDEDQVFKRITGNEELEVRGSDATNGAAKLLVSIEDDSRNSGLRKLIVTNDGASAGNVDLDIDADYNNGSAGLRLTVEVRSGDVNIDNGANVDLSVNLWANSSTSGVAVAGAGVVFAQTGSGAVDVAVAINQGGTTTVSASTLAGPLTANPATVGHVRMDVLGGGIDSLTINEGTFRADNGPINVTWNDNWASGGVFTVNATDITNDDFDINVGNQNTHTGGLRFIGVAEDDVNMTILATANDDTIWGSQRSDSINGGLGQDWIKADPAVGSVVTPGVQMVKTVDFNEADDLDKGDTLSITVGNTVFTYVAATDAATVADAVTNLAAQINGANVDADPDADVSAVANTLTGTVTITGIDLDTDFGYALGENIAVGSTVLDRPVAVITVASESYDIGDVLTINVNGTLYSTTVGVGSTASTLAAALAAAVDTHATLVASANGNQVSISSTTALTTYTITPSWTVDQLTTPATSKTATVTYSAIGGGESVSVTFGGGITVSSNTVAGLASAINGNPTLMPQWNASAVGNVLTLATDVAGAATPANDFSTANFNGSGTATFGTVSGTNAVVRTDNTDPTIGARAVSFALNDAWYDGGDSVTVTINGTGYTFTLPSVGEDPDFTGAQAAAAIAAATPVPALPAGYTVSALGNVVSVTAPDSVAAPIWSVSLADVSPVNAQPEQDEVEFTSFVDVANDNLFVSLTIGAATYTGDTIAALIAAINVGTGTHGYTATVGGTALTVRLTGPASGVEPASSVDNGQVTGTLQAFGGAVTPVSDTGAFAVQRIEDVDFTGFTLADGAGVTVGGISYFTIDRGTAAQTLTYLVGLINAGTGTHQYVASVVDGDTIRLTGPVVAQGGNANPTGGSAALVFPNGGDVTAAAATIGVAAIPEIYTVTATGFDAPTDSVSIRFDTDSSGDVTNSDPSISGNSWAALAQAINDAIAATNLNVLQISSAVAFANRVEIYGPANGGASTTPPIGATFAGTGGPASVGFTAAGAAATRWSQVVSINEYTAVGEVAYVILADGTTVSFSAFAGEAADLTSLAALLETAIGLAPGSSVIAAGGNPDGTGTITLRGNLNGSNPPVGKFVSTVLAGDILVTPGSAGVVTPVVLGVAADAYDVTIDFSLIATDEPPAGKVTEVAEVILAGNLRYSASSVAALVTLINSGTATLPATGPNPASILGHGWVATQGVGPLANTLYLTGNINGTAPNILFDSARLVETQAAAAVETIESWHNLDNTAPVLQVLSGHANSNPALATTTADVAAATATANGNDTVNGGGGNDTILGVGGNDQLNGDDGNDSIEGGTGNDTINGGNGNDLIDGGADGDILNGDAGDDTVIGAGGSDTINGGEGNNRLFGGDGNDTITAGSGNDFIRGGAGKDMLTGGAGIDTFYFTTIGGSESQGAVGFSDQVTDFVSGTDKFQFSFTVNFYANVTNATNLLAGLTDSSVVAGAHAGRAIYDSSAKVLYIDVNGDGAITATDDLVIDLTLTGVSGLSSGDFLGSMPPPGV